MKLCFDIGGMSTKIALISDEKILETDLIKYPNFIEGSELLKAIQTKVKLFFEKNNQIKSINLSTCGIVDSNSGQISGTSAVQNYHVVNYKVDLASFNVPIFVENDANCALIGEFKKNKELSKEQNLASLVVGTGIGGAIMINQQLYKGNGLFAGEFGSLIFEKKLKKFKNFSEVASARAIATIYEEITGKKKDTKELFNLYQIDKEARRSIKIVSENLANLIANIYFMLDPDIILIGGAISKNDFFIKLVTQATERFLKTQGYIKETKIIAASLGNDANLFGAYYLSE